MTTSSQAAFPEAYTVLQAAVLNRTSLEAGNNKFYVLEAHEADGGNAFRVFSHYGRVGTAGVKDSRPCPSRDAALAEYARVLKEKTGPRKGYVLVDVARATVGSGALPQTLPASASPVSTLPPAVARFVEDIYEQSKSELARRIETPLGALSEAQIERGAEALRSLRYALARGRTDSLTALTSQYYTLVPHRLGRWTSADDAAINTPEKADSEEELLQLMRDVFRVQDSLESDTDRKYRALGAHLETVEPESREWRQAEKHVLRTQSHRHPFRLKVGSVLRVCLPHERARWEQEGQRVGNVRTLFHGTRGANMVGILSRGLLIAPKSAPVNGYMFGKGVYFADQSSKSAQYSLRDCSTRRTGYLFLVDVALGHVYKERGPAYREEAPDGHDSVQGCKGTCLVHNEFIIYRTAQCTLRHIVEIELA